MKLIKLFLFAFCLIFTAQMPAMHGSIHEEFSNFCTNCNKPSGQIKKLPCEHQICVSCSDQIVDDNKNVGLPGICGSCSLIYLTGDVVYSDGQQSNKSLFNPAVRALTFKENVQTLTAVLALYATGRCVEISSEVQTLWLIGSVVSVPLLGAYFKFKKMDEVLVTAKTLAPEVPNLSLIMEKRIKAFKTKFGLYALANALILPATLGFGVAAARYDKIFLEKNEKALVFSGVVASSLCDFVLHSWGSRYDSIPKLK